MSENIISISGLTKKYGNFIALNNVTIDLPKGKIIGLLGPNGSGKTTLIKVLTCLLKKYEGQIFIDGKAPGLETKKIVSYLPDRNVLPPRMTIDEIVEYFRSFFDDFDAVKARRLLQNLQIDLSRKFVELSKGMKEKVQLALVLSRDSFNHLLHNSPFCE